MNKKSIFSLILFLLMLCFVANTNAYNNEITHPDITKKAAEHSQLDQYLKDNLGFEAGLENRFSFNNENKTIKDWLKKGSIDEDDPICRATNHFHNPLKPWNESYMSDDTTFLGSKIRDHCESEGWTYAKRKSNITWATGYLSPPPDGQKDSFYTAPDNWDKAMSSTQGVIK